MHKILNAKTIYGENTQLVVKQCLNEMKVLFFHHKN